VLVRVFADWDFELAEVHRPDVARQGYQRGVPMGSDLTAVPDEALRKHQERTYASPIWCTP
jgi:hypothetical protein